MLHEKPMPAVPVIIFDGFNLSKQYARWEEEEQYFQEPAYGFDPDYDPMPEDMETEDLGVTATLEDDDDIPF